MNRFQKFALVPTIGFFAFLAGPSFAGGGGQGVQYSCSSPALKIYIQLPQRPEKRRYPNGTKVLVNTPHHSNEYFFVTDFVETDDNVELTMSAGPLNSHADELIMKWLGNSIVDNIHITENWGMHRNEAIDMKCIPSN